LTRYNITGKRYAAIGERRVEETVDGQHDSISNRGSEAQERTIMMLKSEEIRNL